jgi:hypothetical protein
MLYATTRDVVVVVVAVEREREAPRAFSTHGEF